MTKLYLPESYAARTAPVEIRDAVEQWARQYGGHGDVVWCPDPINCWEVRLSLKDNDPRKRGNPDAYEGVMLHEWVNPKEEPTHPKIKYLRRNARNRPMPGYVSLGLDELGVQGIIAILEKGSLMSGRGEFKTPEDALWHVLNKQRADAAKLRNNQREDARHRAVDLRRTLLNIPFVRVGVSLTSEENSGS